MIVTTKTQYALKLLVDIAAHGNKPVTVKAAAERCRLSEKYLEQVAGILLRAGYLKSTRGAKGGYSLSCPEDTITVGMVLRTVEAGMISASDDSDDETTLDRVVNQVWVDMENAINAVLDSITVADLRQKYNDSLDYMYYI